MRRSVLLPACLAALGLPGAAGANDSTANFVAGGLVMTETDAIAMRSEDLSISTEQVRVLYTFRNVTDAPVTTRVAFPVPEIAWNPYGNIAIPANDPANPLDFTTRVDGKPVAMELEQKASVEGRDVTAMLEGLGVPLAPFDPSATPAMDALPQADQDALVAAGLAFVDEYDAGQGWEKHLAANWTWSGTYHWEQTFQPGEDLKVEHAYAPSVGGSVGTSLGASWAEPDEIARLRERYCIDDAFMRAVEKRTAAAGEGGIAFSEQWVDYILTTGANWAEPIGAFRLRVDKGEAENLVSFCATGVEKISPTTFEVRYENWTPERDLAILILTPSQ